MGWVLKISQKFSIWVSPQNLPPLETPYHIIMLLTPTFSKCLVPWFLSLIFSNTNSVVSFSGGTEPTEWAHATEGGLLEWLVWCGLGRLALAIWMVEKPRTCCLPSPFGWMPQWSTLVLKAWRITGELLSLSPCWNLKKLVSVDVAAAVAATGWMSWQTM